MRASTGRLSIIKGRQLGETKQLLVSAGFRSARRDRRLHLLQAGRRRWSSSAGAALYVYGARPDRQGARWSTPAAVMAAALARQQAARPHRQEHPAEAAREHPQGAARLARHAGDLRRGGARLRRRAEARGGRDQPQGLGARRGAEPDRARAQLHARAPSGAGEPRRARAAALGQRLRQHDDPGGEVRHAAGARLQGAEPGAAHRAHAARRGEGRAGCPRR